MVRATCDWICDSVADHAILEHMPLFVDTGSVRSKQQASHECDDLGVRRNVIEKLMWIRI